MTEPPLPLPSPTPPIKMEKNTTTPDPRDTTKTTTTTTPTTTTTTHHHPPSPTTHYYPLPPTTIHHNPPPTTHHYTNIIIIIINDNNTIYNKNKNNNNNNYSRLVCGLISKLFWRRRFILHKETNLQKKNYIPILQNLYTHTMEMQYIIYMQEACGPPHIDHYRSKLCSLYKIIQLDITIVIDIYWLELLTRHLYKHYFTYLLDLLSYCILCIKEQMFAKVYN